MLGLLWALEGPTGRLTSNHSRATSLVFMTRKLHDNSHNLTARWTDPHSCASTCKTNKNIMLVQIIINCEGRMKTLTQITFLGSKTREQPQATNYQLTLGRGLKALSSPFWQETLRWCGKWVKAHPKSHNRSGLPLLLPPSASTSRGEQFQVPQNTWEMPRWREFDQIAKTHTKMWTCNFIWTQTCVRITWRTTAESYLPTGGRMRLCFTRVCCSSSHTYCNVWSSVSTSPPLPQSLFVRTYSNCVELKLFSFYWSVCALCVFNSYKKNMHLESKPNP